MSVKEGKVYTDICCPVKIEIRVTLWHCLLFYVHMILGLSHEGTSMGCGCYRMGCWGRCCRQTFLIYFFLVLLASVIDGS
jgi:hypothetical protein